MEMNLTPNLIHRLGQVRDKVKTLPKTKEGFGYSYTPLNEILDYLRDILSSVGLVLVQAVSEKEGQAGVETTIFSEEENAGFLSSFAPFPPMDGGGKMTAIQKRGAEITYMRRYALCAMLGLASDEDTDGYRTGKSSDEKTAALSALRTKLAERGKNVEGLEQKSPEELNRLWKENS